MQQDEHARSAPAARPGDPRYGELLEGRYRIGGRIARGGMATVYEAVDIRLDRAVAVKIMHPGMGDDEEFAARFVREARAAARLSHPHVVGVHDQGNDNGTVFLVMELVSGHTLRDTILKESPMPPGRALALIEPVLSALAAAHRAGLIHRDVKPENVLISDESDSGASRIKVADFGLAKAISADTHHTATQGVLIGTVSYLAPELVVDGRADARADVYAVGVMLYELLTGTKPHEGETPIQVAYRHVHHDVPKPSALVPDLPEYVDALLARATARDRSLRPADASVLLHQVHRVSHALADGVREDPELTQDLTPLLTRVSGDTAPEVWDDLEMAQLLTPKDEPTAATPPAPSAARAPAPRPVPLQAPEAPRPPSSRRGPLLLVGALLIALVVGGGAYWFGWARYTSAPAVLGLPKAAAEQKIESAGLDVEWADEAFSETVPAGEVISTDPGPGGRVLEDGTMTVTVSLGKERYDVPKVAGLTLDEGQDALLEVKLSYNRAIERWSETVPEGTVIAADPAVGTTLKPGASVSLVVSKGRRPIKLGAWVGRDIEAVQAAIDKKGLVADITEEFDDSVPKGEVISMDPPDGTLFKGDTVALTVSKGPELVEVPSVKAFGVAAAEQVLEDAGFKTKLENSEAYLGLGFASGTDPGGGELAPKGSTITIYVI